MAPFPESQARRLWGGAVEFVIPTSSNPPTRVSQPHMALPSVVRAAEPNPLEAAIGAINAAVDTYGEDYPALLQDMWAACAADRGPAPSTPFRSER